MIQMAAGTVSQAMQSAAVSFHPRELVLIAPFWRSRQPADRERESSLGMRADEDATLDRLEWSRLIVVVATHRDRTAFVRLFPYFAPRLKTYMQRSGATEASAEELAQEAMLTVWRKAALFDPASAGASASIFAIARNLRIDAFRRERRGGATEVSEVEAEFQIDESPQQDAAFAAMQSETLVRSALAELWPINARHRVVVLRGKGARRHRPDSGHSTWHR